MAITANTVVNKMKYNYFSSYIDYCKNKIQTHNSIIYKYWRKICLTTKENVCK